MQWDLYTKTLALRRLKSARKMLETAKKFIEGYPLKKVNDNDYPKFIDASMTCFRETAKSIKGKQLNLNDRILAMKEGMNSLRTLQKAHYEFLLQLHERYS